MIIYFQENIGVKLNLKRIKSPTFPFHPDFDLIMKCENPYSEKKSRWCLVYKKKDNVLNI